MADRLFEYDAGIRRHTTRRVQMLGDGTKQTRWRRQVVDGGASGEQPLLEHQELFLLGKINFDVVQPAAES